MDAIRVEHLTRRFGEVEAVADVSFRVGIGELFGLLGPNGAGKSTTIHILCTLLRPASGIATIAGCDVSRQADDVRRSIGIIFQDASLDDRLTAMENMRIHARVYHLSARERDERARTLLQMVELWDRRNDLVRTFSGGMKRRLEIARGLLQEPRVLFLDEPTIGLDPQTREHIWTYLERIRHERQTTIFLTTHYMEEADRCDRIAIIDHGQIITSGTPDELKDQVGGDVITLRTTNLDRTTVELDERFHLTAMPLDGTLRLEVAGGEELIPKLVLGLSTPIESISVRRPSLDDVFIAHTGHEIRDSAASGTERMRGTAQRWRR